MFYQGFMALFLVVTYIVLSITIVDKHDISFKLFRFFDLDSEMNLPTFFSSTLILINAFLFYVLWLLKRSDGEPRIVWIFFAVMFLFLAMDEYCSIHEKVGIVFQYVLHLTGKGYWYLTWIVPYGFIVGLIAFYFYRSWRRLPLFIKLWFSFSAMTYLVGAIGFESIGEKISQQHGNVDISYKIVMIMEESLEMVGQIMLEYTLLTMIRQLYSDSILRLTD
jgi:hypothetical protein